MIKLFNFKKKVPLLKESEKEYTDMLAINFSGYEADVSGCLYITEFSKTGDDIKFAGTFDADDYEGEAIIGMKNLKKAEEVNFSFTTDEDNAIEEEADLNLFGSCYFSRLESLEGGQYQIAGELHIEHREPKQTEIPSFDMDEYIRSTAYSVEEKNTDDAEFWDNFKKNYNAKNKKNLLFR